MTLATLLYARLLGLSPKYSTFPVRRSVDQRDFSPGTIFRSTRRSEINIKVERGQKSFRLRYVRETTKSFVLTSVPIIYSRFTIIVQRKKSILPTKVYVTYEDSVRL